MLKKGNKLFSIFFNKCPQCQEGRFFKYGVTLKLKNNLKVYENCESCGLKYMIEPSFFYGAMYVSYALRFDRIFYRNFRHFNSIDTPNHEAFKVDLYQYVCAL